MSACQGCEGMLEKIAFRLHEQPAYQGLLCSGDFIFPEHTCSSSVHAWEYPRHRLFEVRVSKMQAPVLSAVWLCADPAGRCLWQADAEQP